ncbi:chromosome segregation protein SMC [Klugiella xanthotipulae]|uniref:Chromosome partition protein Smc n=1 Tax=Klugiella xanthotipulae TaxID=244735 RepID=A0A543HRU6_9MICO|nr:chromosome segregation protein SMC [Klugiella xanthotipulae]TQM61065.1 condensin subunit Smc [Klugiella xanthotipulae]
MHLKSLTLKGFKSFAQPTTFVFEPGVTAVVGPNGSGKSNVVDALAWVMGEQGAKTLRGGKMEDVIFAGTSTRGPLGRAEVQLTIDNSDGALSIDYSEVTISRTLFRNGASEYAINGENCRLLDVQELLSDSGLGREMHVIVGQGQLDAVLRATPEERRGFIEEAAGILKHRRRKEKTLRKLDAMETNLTRLNDLAGEIRRQLKPLGRQAEVAREAQTIAADVRDAKARILADDVVTLRTALDEYNRSESSRHSERIVLQEQLEQKQLRIARLEHQQVSDVVDTARQTTYSLEAVEERLRGLYTLANQRLALLGSQAEHSELANHVTQAAVSEAEQDVDDLADALPAAELYWEDAQVRTATAREALDAIDEHIAAQSALVSRHDLEISQLTGQRDTAQTRLASVRGEVLRQQNALDAALGRHAKAAQDHEIFAEQVDQSEQHDHDLDEAYEQAQLTLGTAEVEIDRLRELLHGHEREREALSARVSALSLALDRKDASAELLATHPAGLRGRVADQVQVLPGYETAIGAALGTLGEAVLSETHDSAFEAVGLATREELGRVEVVIASAPHTTLDVSDVQDVVPALSVVQAPSGVLGILAHTVIADSLDAARRVAAAIVRRSDLALVTIVTRAGEVLTQQVLRGGSGNAPSRIELTADRDAAAERLVSVEQLIESARYELTEQRGLVQASKDQAARALTELRQNDAAQAAITEKLNRLRVQAEAGYAEAERVRRGLDEASVAVAEAEHAFSVAASALAEAESRPRPILDVSERDSLEYELEEARQVEVESRLMLETARERVRAAQTRLDTLRAQCEAERRQAEESARLAVIRARQVAIAREVADALPDVLNSAARSVSQARVEQGRVEQELAAQNEELTRLRREESELRERLRLLTDDVHSLELQIYEKKLGLSSLLERAGSELGLVEDVLVAEYGPDQPIPVSAEPVAAEPIFDSSTGFAELLDPVEEPGSAAESVADEPGGIPYVRAEQERRLRSAERKLAQLGRVNPLALEEFSALEQRHNFLTEQLADLTKTRQDLLTIIGELDEKMEGIFADAFADTQAAFSVVFPVLFPGGTGSIFLTDPENMLTTGIDVSVRPAGKKIERLSLLSGGERSLAAVALLIAIFKARPSPFYIMDEVEAALDDANLGRLLTIFQDLREHSQLIVITHQKRTMEIADALYGVSMRQDGVSAVVGQRVSEPADRESVSNPA